MTLECTANSERVSRVLKEALATEMICSLRYKRRYFMTTGIGFRHVQSKVLQYVAKEQADADQLAERMVQLGTKPELSFERLLNRSQAEHVEGDSLMEMITADLLAERSTTDGYRDLIASVEAHDPTTRHILELILVQEEEHAEALALLLRGLSPQRRSGFAEIPTSSG